MDEGICELCGNISQLRELEIHHIVPVEVTGQAGMPGSATAILCQKCHQEVYDWYARNVSDMAYNPDTKRFIPKLLVEMVKEYKAAYRVFAEYKRGQRDRV